MAGHVQDDVDRRLFVVGLGNPGRQYAQTRHNVGFRVVDLLASRWSAGEGKAAFGGQLWEVRPAEPQGASRSVVLFEPHTYMNRSGQAVLELSAFYKVQPDELLVVLDDMNLPVGRVRLRAEGSSGGQKGLADVVGQLGTQAVPRTGGIPPMKRYWRTWMESVTSSRPSPLESSKARLLGSPGRPLPQGKRGGSPRKR